MLSTVRVIAPGGSHPGRSILASKCLSKWGRRKRSKEHFLLSDPLSVSYFIFGWEGRKNQVLFLSWVRISSIKMKVQIRYLKDRREEGLGRAPFIAGRHALCKSQRTKWLWIDNHNPEITGLWTVWCATNQSGAKKDTEFPSSRWAVRCAHGSSRKICQRGPGLLAVNVVTLFLHASTGGRGLCCTPSSPQVPTDAKPPSRPW